MDLSKETLKSLRTLATTHKISGRSKLNKDGLITALNKTLKNKKNSMADFYEKIGKIVSISVLDIAPFPTNF
jgi:uncharacterized protein YqeY